MNVFIKKIVILISSLAVFAPLPVLAAELFFDARTQELGIGQEFRVDLLLNTDNEEINATEGQISFPADLLELREAQDGNSIINFWVEKPRIDSSGQITFSGITPGGFKGQNGLTFSMIFRAKRNGQGSIVIQDVKALKNDGAGTPAEVKISNFQFLISNQIPVSQIPTPAIKDKDTGPPETFRPEVARDASLFDGKYFLAFATQDKGSGIDHYEVREGFWSRFVVVESPYGLQNQKLDKKIFVKAVDKAGNERTEILYPPDFRPWYKNYWIFGILIIIVIIGLWLKFIKLR